VKAKREEATKRWLIACATLKKKPLAREKYAQRHRKTALGGKEPLERRDLRNFFLSREKKKGGEDYENTHLMGQGKNSVKKDESTCGGEEALARFYRERVGINNMAFAEPSQGEVYL